MPAPPVHHVAFDESGQFVDRDGYEATLAAADAPADILVFSHGWKNSFADASALYDGLLGQMETVLAAHPDLDAGNRLALGVIWPSKAWDEDAEGRAPVETEAVYESLSPQRASSSGFRADVLRMSQMLLADQLGARDRNEFRSLLQRHADRPEPDDESSVFDDAGDEALEGLTPPGFSARNLFRQFTYWQMKKRAGVVGKHGVRRLIALAQKKFPQAKVHLVGHSFGCKVMLAAVAASGDPTPRAVDSVVLLQGAVSFESMAESVRSTNKPGGYLAATDAARVAGPVVATYSQHDDACGRAYPLASKLARHTGDQELEGMFDPYRALGAVGAYGVAEDLDHWGGMLDVGQAYGFAGRGVWSVDAGTAPADFIQGHSDLLNPQVAWLIWSAIRRR